MAMNQSSQPKKSTLAKKLNITLFFIFCLGMALSGVTLATLISYEAYKQTLSKALLIMNSLDAVQYYTTKEVKPQVQQRLKNKEVLPQTVPSYAAGRVFERLRQSDEFYNNFFYKNVILNPNNTQDNADKFERNIVENFRQSREVKQLEGFHSMNNEYFFYIARPLTLAKSKLANNANEIVGTQIVSIPIRETAQDYALLFVSLWGIIAVILIFIILIINLWLRRSIIRSIKKIVKVAEAVSTGNMEADFEKESNDEIGSLVEAFTRMKMSLVMAIEKFEQYRIKSRKSDSSKKLDSGNITPHLRE
ncbi:DUF3365 domain-containing protein [Floridanema aerugineum]|uniref:DUF3365 domain-containing protein n=1 Tax=Floridaenema aerugineum BLCC-F46 TaxID=3153654 RepID=A0ABV4X0K7_9CYAN